MTRKQEIDNSDGHPDCLFLLPFNEAPSSVLLDPKPLPDELGHQGHDQIQQFRSCVLNRTSRELLTCGDADAPNNTAFRLSVGQFVLLRPIDNATRPNVALVLSFHLTGTGRGGSKRNRVRIRWMYRGEDLGAMPPSAVGEDEVFETIHCDTVDVDVIVGRCSVTSYPEWVRQTLAGRKPPASSLLPQEPTEVDLKSTGRPRRSPRLTRHAENDTMTNGFDAHEVANGSDAAKSPDNPELVYTDEEDANSIFISHFDNSSLRLFCRRFYDPLSQRFLASKFECKLADPIEELAEIRLTDTRVDRNNDPGFDAEAATAAVSSSDSDPEPNFETGLGSLLDAAKNVNGSTEDVDLQTPSRKRPRGQARRSRVVKRRVGGGGGGVQFALPTELGGVEQLPCRDEQKAHVREFLLSAIRAAANGTDDASRSLYISGVPGTGKTATVREIVRDLRQQLLSGLLPPFTVLELNAMSLADPGLVYVELYAAIAGVRGVAPSHAAQLLEQSFSETVPSHAENSSGQASKALLRKRGRPAGPRAEGVVIVVLDEMDVLLARRQKVLYDLLEWPMRPGARLALIGIANTMDLPERMLPRMGSRLGLNRLVYPPYTSDQLITILKLTLDQHEFSFRSDALTLCAKKIGGISGDVRRALELCRRATEQARSGQASTTDDGRIEITAQHMQTAAREAASDYRLVALNQLSLFERLALVSAISLARRQGSFAVDSTSSVDAVSQAARDIVARNDEPFKVSGKPTTAELEEACWRLAAQRMLVIEKAAVHRQSRVIVNVPVDDCIQALQECSMCKKVLSEP